MSYPVHSFRLVLDRWPADVEFDDLADLCNDAGFDHTDREPRADFDRASPTLIEAISSAINDLRQLDLCVVRVEPVSLLWWVDVAHRVGMPIDTLEAKIAASPIAHSKPMPYKTMVQGSFYHWPDVVDWLAVHGITQHYDKTVEATNTALGKVSPDDRFADRMARAIHQELNHINAWKMPEWMEPWRSFIAETGGNDIEGLIFSFDYDRNLMRTNIPRFVLACMARAQVGLLERLHKDGCLPPAPNSPGGW